MPDSRIAGIATSAPTGTTTSPASEQRQQPREPEAVGEVRERSGADRRETGWQSDTCPDVRTRRPSDRKRMTLVSPSV